MTQTPENQQQYGSILTILGENAEQNGKLQNKQISFTHIAIGDANDAYVQPDRGQSALVNELHRIQVNSVDVLQPTPDSVPMLKVEAILPDNVNDLIIREFAAVAEFNGQTYFHAVGNCARIYVPPPVNNGNVLTPVTLEMIFVITSAEPIIEIDPNVVTASRDYVQKVISKRQNAASGGSKQLDLISGNWGQVADGVDRVSLDDKSFWYAWDEPTGVVTNFVDNRDYGTATMTCLQENGSNKSFEFVSPHVNVLRGRNAYPTVKMEARPEGWGAKGNGVRDDTFEIQKAIDEVNNVVLSAGKRYMVNAVYKGSLENRDLRGIETRDSTRLYFEPDSELKALPNDSDRYCVLWIDSPNVKVYYPRIIGDRDEHITTPNPNNTVDGFSGEWGYGIRVNYNAENVYIKDPWVVKCWGDSYLIITNKSNITIENPYGAYSRRQGMSVIRGKGIKIKGIAHFEHISGTFPMAGIDLEPDLATESIDIEIDDLTVNDCGGYNIEMNFQKQNSNSVPHNIIFRGKCILDNWMRLKTNKNVGVKNNIDFNVIDTRVFVFDAMNYGDDISIKKLICSEPPYFRVETEGEQVSGYPRIDISQVVAKEDFLHAITVANSSQLENVAFPKKSVTISEYILPEGTSVTNLTKLDRATFHCNIGDIDSEFVMDGLSVDLNMKNYLSKRIVFNKSNPVTNLLIEKDCKQSGTDIELVGRLNSVDFIPDAGVLINGLTNTIRLTAPFEAVLSGSGNEYTLKVTYKAN